MKSLLDIQQDIRELESSVKEIAGHMETIRSDIEDLRNSDQVLVIDYAKIEILAKQIPFNGHPLKQLADKRICRIYLEMLLMIVRLEMDGETAVNRLVFLQWLQMQSGVDLPLEELFKDCHKISKDSYFEFVDAIPAEYKDFFLVDGLVTAGISGTLNREAAEYIADLGVVFGLEEEKLRILFLISRMALSQSVKGISRGDLYKAFRHIRDFGHYLGEVFAKQGIIALRDVTVEIPENAFTGFKWKVENYKMVEAGEVIATFKKVKDLGNNEASIWKGISSPAEESEKGQVLASSSGKLFQFRNKGIWYGVIAHETDHKDSIKEWVKDNS